MKKVLSLLTAVLIAAMCLVDIKPVMAATKLTGKNAMEITEMMGLGWNLGNTFDATGGNAADVYSQEQSWGNPKVTKDLIKGVKASGFNSIRIPVTWYKHMDSSYKVDDAFMNRVKEVVDYAIDEGMFVILNAHHEPWVNDPNLDTNYTQIGKQLEALWKQISEKFADYDQHLIFEGMNEPRKQNTNVEWTGNTKAYEAVNYLDDIFVNTVRKSGKGNNAERCLMVPGYAASSSASVLQSIKLPKVDGQTAKNLIISVHCYSPYDFCLADTKKDFDPNDSGSVSEINSLFALLDDMFLSEGIPVVIGETSATAKNNVPARVNWAKYMAQKSAGYGVPIVIWDNGSNSNSGGESHAHLNRRTGKPNYPDVIDALVQGYASVALNSSRKANQAQVPSLIDGTVIWNDANGHKSTKEWDSSFIQISSLIKYYGDGKEIAVVYSGSAEVKMILDSEVWQKWWMPVDPSRVENVNGKNVAYFSMSNIDAALSSAGVPEYKDLRYLSFITTGTDVTAYEVSVIGMAQQNPETVAPTTTAVESATTENVTTTEGTTTENSTTESATTESATTENTTTENTTTASTTTENATAENVTTENVTSENLTSEDSTSVASSDNNTSKYIYVVIACAVVIVAGISVMCIILVKNRKKSDK